MFLTVDFETHYNSDSGYSLKDMTMEEYITDRRFKVLGVSVKVDNQESQWITSDYDFRLVEEADAVIMHNAYFDGFILNHHFGVKPKRYLDTMLLARAVMGCDISASLRNVAKELGVGVKGGEELIAVDGLVNPPRSKLKKLGQYACNDVDLTYDICMRLYKKVPRVELQLMDLIIRMFTEPRLILNKDTLLPRYQELLRKDAEHLQKVSWILDKTMLPQAYGDYNWLERVKEMLMSNDQLAQILRDNGVEPPTKTSQRTGKPTYAFSKNDVEFLALKDHDKVGSIIEARLSIKSVLESTRIKKLLDKPRNEMPIYLNYGLSRTWRLSGGEGINWQNMERGGVVRKALEAPEGYMVAVADSGQIEARINAWLAGDSSKLEVFRNPKPDYDVYCYTAEKIFNKPVTKKNKDLRLRGKITELAAGYQLWWPKFQKTLATDKNNPIYLSDDEAKSYIIAWRDLNPLIVEQWTIFQNALDMMVDGKPFEYGPLLFHEKGINLPNGMTIFYNNLTRIDDKFYYEMYDRKTRQKHRVSIYGGKVCENVVQALARIIVMEQMLEISKYYKVVLTVHDEVVCVTKDAEQAVKDMVEIMSTPLDWCADLPLSAEGDYAKNYSK